MQYLRTLALLALCLLVSAFAVAADWAKFLGPQANGFSPETGINKDWGQKPPALLWKIALTDNGFAAPAVANGLVYIVDHQGSQDIVRALSLKDGVEAWRFAYEDTNKDNAGWGFTNSTPLVQDGKVYTYSHLGVLHCFNAKTGAKLWARDLVTELKGRRPGWNLAVSPFLDGDKLIMQVGGANVIAALNKDTGETIWQGGGSETPGYANPVIATLQGKRQYIISTANSIIGVDPENGQRLWLFDWKNSCNVNGATPIVIGNSIYITANYGRGAALLDITPEGPKQIWAKPGVPTYSSRFTTPLFKDGFLYVTGEANKLVCIEAATGTLKWEAPSFGWGGLVGIDGVMIVLDGDKGDAVMVKISPEKYEELGRLKAPLGGRSWTAPIIADGKLLIRNQTAIACFDLK